MAVSSIKRRSGGPIRSNIAKMYQIVIKARIVGTVVDPVDPSAGYSVEHAGATGIYNLNFDLDAMPRNVLFMQGGSDVLDTFVRLRSYDNQTGVLEFAHEEAGAEADVTDAEVTIICLCSDSSLSDYDVAPAGGGVGP